MGSEEEGVCLFLEDLYFEVIAELVKKEVVDEELEADLLIRVYFYFLVEGVGWEDC